MEQRIEGGTGGLDFICAALWRAGVHACVGVELLKLLAAWMSCLSSHSPSKLRSSLALDGWLVSSEWLVSSVRPNFYKTPCPFLTTSPTPCSVFSSWPHRTLLPLSRQSLLKELTRLLILTLGPTPMRHSCANRPTCQAIRPIPRDSI